MREKKFRERKVSIFDCPTNYLCGNRKKQRKFNNVNCKVSNPLFPLEFSFITSLFSFNSPEILGGVRKIRPSVIVTINNGRLEVDQRLGKVFESNNMI